MYGHCGFLKNEGHLKPLHDDLCLTDLIAEISRVYAADTAAMKEDADGNTMGLADTVAIQLEVKKHDDSKIIVLDIKSLFFAMCNINRTALTSRKPDYVNCLKAEMEI